MKTFILIIYTVLLSGYTIGQNNIVDLDFEIDGNQSEYKVGVVKFIYKSDTTVVNIEKGKLTIPLLVLKKNAAVIFCLDNYVLQFDSIPLSVNDLYPVWTLGIDEKPFEKKKFTTIKQWKKIQVVFYLQNNYGRIFTVWRYKKSLIVK